MNEDQNKSPQIKSLIGNVIPTTENHPLHILDNQVDPETKPKKPDAGQKPIRTYESDVAEALSRQKSSVVNIAIAESERKAGEASISNKPPSKVGRNILYLMLSLILIVSGLGGGYYLYLQSPLANAPLVEQKAQIPSIIKPDIQKTLNISSLQGRSLMQLLSDKFLNQQVQAGGIFEIVPVEVMGSTTIRTKASKFIGSLNTEASDSFTRSLTDRMMVGIYSPNDPNIQGNIPFIILTTDFFQNAFSGMLMWEKTMPEELADLFNYREKASPIIEKIDVASTTAGLATTSVATTTTKNVPRISKLYEIRGTFEDKTIMNRDVRELISVNGDVLLVYSFIDKNTLIITTSDVIIPVIIDRIEKQTYLR